MRLPFVAAFKYIMLIHIVNQLKYAWDQINPEKISAMEINDMLVAAMRHAVGSNSNN